MSKQRPMKSIVVDWLLATILAAVLCTTPTWAHAGLVGLLIEHAAMHSVEHGIEHHVRESRAEAGAPALPQTQDFRACPQFFPGGIPFDVTKVDPAWKPRALCFKSFAVLYSGLAKAPLLVFERLSRQTLTSKVARTENFFPDPRIPRNERAELSDFAGSYPKWERGHMAPAADQYDLETMAGCFSLANMVVQDGQNNEHQWAKIESDTRKFALRASGDVYTTSGPKFEYAGAPRTLGRGQVWIPTTLFKFVYDEASGRSWAHIIPNTADAVVGPPTTYAGFVQSTGWSLLANVPVQTQLARH